MIELPKFTYSPLGKTFEKTQKKRLNIKEKRQMKETEDHEKRSVESNAFSEKEEKSIPINKQQEIFYNFVAERTG